MTQHITKLLKRIPWFRLATNNEIPKPKPLKWASIKRMLIHRPVLFGVPTTVAKVYTEISNYDVEENIAHLMTMARIALEKGDLERAEAILLMGIKISEEYKSYAVLPYMYDILASIAFATGNLRKAETLLVNAIEKLVHLGVPENDNQVVDFKLRLARIYSAYNELELAEIGFKSCLDEQKDKIEGGDTTTRTGLLYINCMFWYGLHKVKKSKYKEAKDLINSAYDYSIKIKGLSPYQEMVILYTLGDLNMELGEYNLALQNLQSAILMGKGIGSLDLPRCYLKVAKIYTKMDAWDTAKISAKEALRLGKLFNDELLCVEADNLLMIIDDNLTLKKKQ
ncbi:unnamed protein product [Brassicogethes aeneus]|uniref:MalT-like TPR region domain-containing protein n=1 Tax=Brassicogethes aeneus TaxID=1431903 RepID=A0A9P0B9X9_BRAAE|nr:unnamed protein product [Brassicogethes aeneus]